MLRRLVGSSWASFGVSPSRGYLPVRRFYTLFGGVKAAAVNIFVVEPAGKASLLSLGVCFDIGNSKAFDRRLRHHLSVMTAPGVFFSVIQLNEFVGFAEVNRGLRNQVECQGEKQQSTRCKTKMFLIEASRIELGTAFDVLREWIVSSYLGSQYE
jgi:hypothetical protein